MSTDLFLRAHTERDSTPPRDLTRDASRAHYFGRTEGTDD